MGLDADGHFLAMTFTSEEQRLHGKNLKTDHQGLPSDLRLPPPHPLLHPQGNQPVDTAENSAHASQIASADTTASTTAANTENTTAVTTPVHEDEPPPEFLTEQPLEGVPHEEKEWTATQLLANKKALLDVQVKPLNATLEGNPEEGAVPRTNTIEEVEAFTERRALSPRLPQVPQDEVPLEALQGLSEHMNRAEYLEEKTKPAQQRAHAAIEQLRADLESARIEFDRRSQRSVRREQDQDGLLGAQMRLRGGWFCGFDENEDPDTLSITPGWEENLDHGSVLGTDAARAVACRVDREPMNSENCGYYIGRRDPGPGAAPPQERQIGFQPEEGAWMVLMGYRHAKDYR